MLLNHTMSVDVRLLRLLRAIAFLQKKMIAEASAGRSSNWKLYVVAITCVCFLAGMLVNSVSETGMSSLFVCVCYSCACFAQSMLHSQKALRL